MKPKSRQSSASGQRLARAATSRTRAGAPGVSPSGASPISARRTREESRRQHADDDDRGNRRSRRRPPEIPSGRSRTPTAARRSAPRSSRRYRRCRAPTGRARTNQGETTALTATPPIAAQPAPLTSVAANSCHGAAAIAQPQTPADKRTAATMVTPGNAEAAVERRHVGDDERAGEVMHRHGGRDDPEREPARLAHRMQVDRRAVETEAPAEERQHEGRADDPPAIESSPRRQSLEPAPLCARGRARRYGARRSIGVSGRRRAAGLGENCRSASTASRP